MKVTTLCDVALGLRPRPNTAGDRVTQAAELLLLLQQACYGATLQTSVQIDLVVVTLDRGRNGPLSAERGRVNLVKVQGQVPWKNQN